ncbi:MAG: hypothetical protein WCN27_00010 [Alphaproteobacteria bacterium]
MGWSPSVVKSALAFLTNTWRGSVVIGSVLLAAAAVEALTGTDKKLKIIRI